MLLAKPARPTVLIVDDVDDVRLGYRFILETDEFQVLDVPSARDALILLDRKPVDVVLTDIYMPGNLDGVALVQEIRRRSRSRPAIIAMSGSPHLAYRSSLQAAYYVGADATLTKPISRENLVRTIRSLIGGGPALLAQASNPASTAKTRKDDRRARLRTSEESRATTLVQTVLADPPGAFALLERDLKEGGDVTVVSTLLDLARTSAKLRGLDLQRSVDWIRERLFQAGFTV